MSKIKQTNKQTNKQTSTLLTIQSIHKTVPRHALFLTHVKKGSLLDREKKIPREQSCGKKTTKGITKRKAK